MARLRIVLRNHQEIYENHFVKVCNGFIYRYRGEPIPLREVIGIVAVEDEKQLPEEPKCDDNK